MLQRCVIRDTGPGIFIPAFEPYGYNTTSPGPPLDALHPLVVGGIRSLYVNPRAHPGQGWGTVHGPYDVVWGVGSFQGKTLACARRGKNCSVIWGTEVIKAGDEIDGAAGIVHGQPCFRSRIDGIWRLIWGEHSWKIQGDMQVSSLHVLPSPDGSLADIVYLTIDQRKMAVVWNEEPGRQFDDILHFSVINGRVMYVGRNLGFWYIVQDNLISKPFDGLLYYEVINGQLLAVGYRRETSVDTSWYVLTGNGEPDCAYRGVFNLAIDRTAGIVRFDESVTERGNHQRQVTLR